MDEGHIAPYAVQVAPYAVAALGVGLVHRRRVLARRGPDPLGEPPRALPADLGATLLLALVLWFAFIQAAHSIAVSLRLPPGPRTFAGACAHLLVALCILPRVLPAWRGAAAPTLTAARQGVLGVCGGVAAYGLSSLAGLALSAAYSLSGIHLPTQAVVDFARTASGGDAVLAAVSAVVLAPFAEEVVYRGTLLPTLARAAGAERANLLQAALFGAMHVLNQPLVAWPLAIPLGLVGWCAGYLALRTGSLGAAIVLHAVFNGIHFAFLRLLG